MSSGSFNEESRQCKRALRLRATKAGAWLLFGVLCAGGLAGCGQKGDLYLPDHPVSQRQG